MVAGNQILGVYGLGAMPHPHEGEPPPIPRLDPQNTLLTEDFHPREERGPDKE